MHPSDPRLPILLKHIEELAVWLGMGHWIFHVSEEAAKLTEYASISSLEQDEANIHIGTNFWGLSGTEKNRVLIHELSHPEVTRIHESMHDGIKIVLNDLPKNKRSSAEAHLKIHEKAAARREEQLVNRLAKILAPFAPPFPDM